MSLRLNQLVGFGVAGSVVGSIPSYVSSGDAAAGTWSVNVPYPAGVQAGDILLLQARASYAGELAEIEPGIGWTLVGSVPQNSGQLLWAFFWKRAVGTESGNLAVTGGIDSIYGRMHAYRGCIQSGTPFENSGTQIEAASTTITQLSIVSTGANRKGVQLTSYNIATTATAFTGETGGDFTEPVAESTVTSFGAQIQDADMASATTISGGTATLGMSATKARCVFALLPTS